MRIYNIVVTNPFNLGPTSAEVSWAILFILWVFLSPLLQQEDIEYRETGGPAESLSLLICLFQNKGRQKKKNL